MKISTKGRYGLRAMIDLAIHSKSEFISLKTIANRQGISLNYLEHSFSALKKAGLVSGLAGAKGGYKLSKNPNEITVKMILTVLEGDLSIVEEIPQEKETPLQACIRHYVWDIIDQKINFIVETTTVEDMIRHYIGIHPTTDV